MQGLFILLVLMVVAIAIPLAIAHNKKVNEAWASASRQLGFRFTPASFGKSRCMQGRYRETAVKVDSYTQRHGKSSTTYTRFRVQLPTPLGLGLELKSEGFFSGIKKAFGGRDIEVGDESFDDAVLVKGADQERVIAFLTPARRVRIHRFLSSHTGASIRDREIKWSRTGLMSSAEQLTAAVRRISELAHSVSGVRKADEAIERALEARNEGRVEEALAFLAPTSGVSLDVEPDAASLESLPPGTEPLVAGNVDEKLLEGELHYLADRREEARQAFETALAGDPEDAEILQWVEEVSAERDPSPAEATEARADLYLDLETLCGALFTAGSSSLDVTRIFDTQFKERAVRWSGVLTDARKYGYDSVFGGGGGTKATLEIGETETTAYGAKKILAIVQLPEAAAEELRDRIGETLVFRGVLKRADGFLRNLFVAEGSLE